jgi:hypothetical protein|tara:strand:- start:369 stop:614 length:246 start_codon:yes stop_codon:yes gene_type:complete
MKRYNGLFNRITELSHELESSSISDKRSIEIVKIIARLREWIWDFKRKDSPIFSPDGKLIHPMAEKFYSPKHQKRFRIMLY